MGHKFFVGQNVFYNTPPRVSAAGGVYTIIAKLPIETGRYVYRIKSAVELFERIADEGDLSLANLKDTSRF